MNTMWAKTVTRGLRHEEGDYKVIHLLLPLELILLSYLFQRRPPFPCPLPWTTRDRCRITWRTFWILPWVIWDRLAWAWKGVASNWARILSFLACLTSCFEWFCWMFSISHLRKFLLLRRHKCRCNWKLCLGSSMASHILTFSQEIGSFSCICSSFVFSITCMLSSEVEAAKWPDFAVDKTTPSILESIRGRLYFNLSPCPPLSEVDRLNSDGESTCKLAAWECSNTFFISCALVLLLFPFKILRDESMVACSLDGNKLLTTPFPLPNIRFWSPQKWHA